jgi:hypothetical protein
MKITDFKMIQKVMASESCRTSIYIAKKGGYYLIRFKAGERYDRTVQKYKTTKRVIEFLDSILPRLADCWGDAILSDYKTILL